ncbi:hypothetical protein [Hamadaea tsunoensis]|uniref:hypothetical protein n=1 Tax=Hamadaea tsunoensis TaxID=53368 RepID=UPI0003F881F6|nr:hypothetical protein [Hamadaea tsunoensis]
MTPGERLIAAASRLLPRAYRDWGSAMAAELRTIDGRAERWRFTVGCLRVLFTRPAVVRAVGYPVLTAVTLGLALWWSGRFAYAPLRIGAVAVVASLVALGWLGRVRGPLGPVRSGATARGVRTGGYALVALWTVGLLTAMGGKDPVGAGAAAPVVGAVSVAYLAAFLILTARRTPERVLLAALAGGGGPVLLWTLMVAVFPPIPAGASAALLLIGIGMAGAAAIAGPELRLVAIGGAGMLACLLLWSLVVALSAYAPATLIPDLAAPALSAADDLAQSRSEIQDPYVGLIVLGGALALLPIAAALWTAGRRAAGTRALG